MLKKELYQQYLNIRYTKLFFTIRLTEDTKLPPFKTSALRGGIGEMLLRANCVRDRQCENCDFYEECMVQRIMYSQYEIRPDFVSKGDSIGYVLECENYEEEFHKGDRITFQLLLFGKTIVYFNQILQAIHSLGLCGIGKRESRFLIEEIRNEAGEPLLFHGNILMEHYRIQTVCDYVEKRLSELHGQAEAEQIDDWKKMNISEKLVKYQASDNKDEQKCPVTLRFCTPVDIKYQKEFLTALNMNAILHSLKRRVYMMNCFEGIDAAEWYSEPLPLCDTRREDSRKISISRYSNRKSSSMELKGLVGTVSADVDIDILPLIAAGELIHIGKNTSFGYGRYFIEL